MTHLTSFGSSGKRNAREGQVELSCSSPSIPKSLEEDVRRLLRSAPCHEASS